MDTNDIIMAGGGPTAVGRKLGVSHSSVSEWRKTGRVPVGHVLKLEEITGIPRHQLRPDIYQAPQQVAIGHETQPSEPSYGSTEWLTARRNERPALRMSSVELLNALHDEDWRNEE